MRFTRFCAVVALAGLAAASPEPQTFNSQSASSVRSFVSSVVSSATRSLTSTSSSRATTSSSSTSFSRTTTSSSSATAVTGIRSFTTTSPTRSTTGTSTVTPTVTASPTPSNDSTGLSTGAIIAIAVGIVILLAVVGAIIAFILIRRRKKRAQQTHLNAAHSDPHAPGAYQGATAYGGAFGRESAYQPVPNPAAGQYRAPMPVSEPTMQPYDPVKYPPVQYGEQQTHYQPPPAPYQAPPAHGGAIEMDSIPSDTKKDLYPPAVTPVPATTPPPPQQEIFEIDSGTAAPKPPAAK